MGLSLGTFLWSSRSALFPTTIKTTSFRFRFSSLNYIWNTCQSHPRFYIQVRLGICHIVHNQNPRGSFVVNFTQRFVSLLTSSIPNGHFDVLVADLDNFGKEFNSNSAFLGIVVLISNVSRWDVCLAGALTADNNDLEHFVVFIHGIKFDPKL